MGSNIKNENPSNWQDNYEIRNKVDLTKSINFVECSKHSSKYALPKVNANHKEESVVNAGTNVPYSLILGKKFK